MKHILIVDDDVAVASIAGEALRGYGVTIVHSGPEALALAGGGPGFDLLITDYQLPSIPGDELAKRFRASFPSIKTLMMTGSDALFDRDEPVTDCCLQKPFQLHELRESVTRLIGAC